MSTTDTLQAQLVLKSLEAINTLLQQIVIQIKDLNERTETMEEQMEKIEAYVDGEVASDIRNKIDLSPPY